MQAANKHLERLDVAGRRIKRAAGLHDHPLYTVERETAAALVYEAFDHLCMAFVLLDFTRLELSAAADGSGLIGDTVLAVLHIIDAMEAEAKQLLRFEHENHVRLDFLHPIDEREGVTYQTHRHWQDFVKGSIQESFTAYFAQTRRAVRDRLAQRPPYWEHQTVRGYLERRGCFALLTLFHRLETVALEHEEAA